MGPKILVATKVSVTQVHLARNVPNDTKQPERTYKVRYKFEISYPRTQIHVNRKA